MSTCGCLCSPTCFLHFFWARNCIYPPETSIAAETWWLRDYFPFWGGPFSGAMLVLGRVHIYCMSGSLLLAEEIEDPYTFQDPNWDPSKTWVFVTPQRHRIKKTTTTRRSLNLESFTIGSNLDSDRGVVGFSRSFYFAGVQTTKVR